MNIYALTFGLLIALLTMWLFKFNKAKNIQIAYAWYLASFSVYYVLFALNVGDMTLVIIEILIGSMFSMMDWFCIRLDEQTYPLALSSAYLLHAVYDVFHSYLLTNSETPEWWPEFCGSIVIILGIYIASLLITQRREQAVFNCIRS